MRNSRKRKEDPGSSPRGRGTPPAEEPSWVRYRFIPAWAGNTRLGADSRGTGPVHPRVGGEHMSPTLLTNVLTGSSPRGRGTHFRIDALPRHRRFIPAWAGNTRHRRHQCSPAWVHPRVGGEHLRPMVSLRDGSRPVHPRVGGEHRESASSSRPSIGSSPRGRGTRRRPRRRGRLRRFIPAWAGNTRLRPFPVRAASVHPRVGGEHSHRHHVSDAAAGSSPRGRGTPHLSLHGSFQSRFIPAWAGNTGGCPTNYDTRPVHPRVGGEHSILPHHVLGVTGSSPRGRGTLHRAAHHERLTITGSSPRGRGTRHLTSGGTKSPSGSSPRGRGTPTSRFIRRLLNRFIPAWAGNTRLS